MPGVGLAAAAEDATGPLVSAVGGAPLASPLFGGDLRGEGGARRSSVPRGGLGRRTARGPSERRRCDAPGSEKNSKGTGP